MFLVRRLSKLSDFIMSTKPKPISNTISFLIARVGTAHSYGAGKLLSDIGLYLGQEMVLQYLW